MKGNRRPSGIASAVISSGVRQQLIEQRTQFGRRHGFAQYWEVMHLACPQHIGTRVCSDKDGRHDAFEQIPDTLDRDDAVFTRAEVVVADDKLRYAIMLRKHGECFVRSASREHETSPAFEQALRRMPCIALVVHDDRKNAVQQRDVRRLVSTAMSRNGVVVARSVDKWNANRKH